MAIEHSPPDKQILIANAMDTEQQTGVRGVELRLNRGNAISIPVHLAILSREFKHRVTKNPRYSLRAYAGFLGVHPSALSRIFAGKQDLSLRGSIQTANKLALNEEERRLFLQSVSQARTERERKRLSRALNHETLQPEPIEISPTEYGRILNLTCLAILELTFCVDFAPDPLFIAQRLGRPESEIHDALHTLFELKLLEGEVGREIRNPRKHMTAVKSDETDATRKRHQAEILQRAEQSLEHDPFTTRAHYGMVMAIDASRIEEARRRLLVFMEDLCDFLSTSNDKKDVYQLAVQLFPLTAGNS